MLSSLLNERKAQSVCLTNSNGKGEGVCCCCLYSVQPLRGFLHRAERSFFTTSSFLSREKRWELELCRLPVHTTDPGKCSLPSLHSCAISSSFKLIGTGTVMPRGKSPLQQEVCRSCSSAELPQTSLHPPLSQSLHSAQSSLQLWDRTSGNPEIQTEVMLKRFSHLEVA